MPLTAAPRAAAALPLLAAAAAARDHKGWENTTLYRLTPANLTGLLNMNSADAAGDVMFGLNQMLIPVICPENPSMSWCKSSHPHKGGPVPLVYTQFVVSADPRKGDYAACNPVHDSLPLVYECGHWHSTVPVPEQCKKGFMMYHEDCLNGTVYHSLPAVTDKGACCAACSADDKCRGWNLGNATGCDLLTDPLVTWGGGQAQGQCQGAAERNSEADSGENCWYDNKNYSRAFSDLCKKEQCSCPAVETLSLGVEYGAMCWRHNGNATNASSAARRRPRRLSGGVAAPPADSYWSCAAAVFDKCAAEMWAGDSAECSACAAAVPGCTAEGVAAACSPDPKACSAAVWGQCGKPTAGDQIYDCTRCAYAADAEAPLRAAGCNASLVNEACGAHTSTGWGGGGKWQEYMDGFACKMDGVWYSTQGAGRCNTTDPTEDCWWRVAETAATKWQDCVEGRLVASVRALNSTCWDACPQPNNETTPCYLDCMYTTLLHESVPSSQLSSMFAAAFAAESDGGCPDAVWPTPPPAAAGGGAGAAPAAPRRA